MCGKAHEKHNAINFLEGVGNTSADENQDRGERLLIRKDLTDEQRSLLEKFDYTYFETALGYGGYFYDGRYGIAAERMIQYYGLKHGCKVLDVGCAKGFLVYEFHKRLYNQNGPVAFGCDISSYAIDYGHQEVKAQLFKMGANNLDFPDDSFDLVVSIDTIHNLTEAQADKAICEMMRVSRGNCFIQVASYSTSNEEKALHVWGATVKTFRNKSRWVKSFDQIGYAGEYWFKTFML